MDAIIVILPMVYTRLNTVNLLIEDIASVWADLPGKTNRFKCSITIFLGVKLSFETLNETIRQRLVPVN